MCSPTAGPIDPDMTIHPDSTLGKWLHWLFDASLIFKGLLAGAEALAGLSLFLTPNSLIITYVGWLTRHELTQDPNDDMARWFEQVAQQFPIQTQHFYAVYLLAHGALKLTMVLLLARRIVWAYPAAMFVLAGFVTYQMSEVFRYGSPVLLLLSALDTLMIVLVWREWGLLKARPGVA
jgi:uncharacterized membrane protein